VHGKKNEQGLALEPFSVTLQVRVDRGGLRPTRRGTRGMRLSARACASRD
jgi:hypothetical protein